MSKRKRSERGIYQRPDGTFEVNVQPTKGAQSPVFVGRFERIEMARAYRAACLAANELGVAHQDPVEFAVRLLGEVTVDLELPDPELMALLWCADANDIDRRTVRYIIRGGFDLWDKKKHRKPYRRRIQRLFERIDEGIGLNLLPLDYSMADDFLSAQATSLCTQEDLDLMAWLLARCSKWGKLRGLQEYDDLASSVLTPIAIRPKGRTLRPGSLTSRALEIMQHRPGVAFTTADLAEALVADGYELAEGRTVASFAAQVGATLQSRWEHQRTPGLFSPLPGLFSWDPVASAPPVHVLDLGHGDPRRAYTPSEIVEIAKWMPTELRVVIWLIGVLGLRTGEALGARIRHFDPKTGILRIRDQSGAIDPTSLPPGEIDALDDEFVKTPMSRRNLQLPPTLAAFVTAYILLHHGPDAFTDPDKANKRIVVAPGSGPLDEISYSRISTRFARALFWSRLQWRPNGSVAQVYDLRHSLATTLRGQVRGGLRSVWLGHKLRNDDDSAAITNDVYTHVKAEDLLEVTDVLEKIVVTEMNGLVIDDSDLDEWIHTNEVIDLLDVQRATIIKLLGIPGRIHDPRKPHWKSAYRRDTVMAVIDLLDAEPGMLVSEFATAFGLQPAEVRQLGADGDLDVRRRYYRPHAGGPVRSAEVVTLAHRWPADQ